MVSQVCTEINPVQQHHHLLKFAKGVLHFVRLDFENDDYAHLKSKIKPEQTPVEGKHHLPRQIIWLVLFCRQYKQTLARIRPEADGNFTIDKQDKHHHLQPHHLPKVFNWPSFGGWAHPIAMALLETWWKWAVLWCFHALLTEVVSTEWMVKCPVGGVTLTYHCWVSPMVAHLVLPAWFGHIHFFSTEKFPKGLAARSMIP